MAAYSGMTGTHRERRFLVTMLKLVVAMAVLVAGTTLSLRFLPGVAGVVGSAFSTVAAWSLAFWAARGTRFDMRRGDGDGLHEPAGRRSTRRVLALVFAVCALVALRTEGPLRIVLAVVAVTAGALAWSLLRPVDVGTNR